MAAAPVDTPERQAFYAKIDKSHLTPLWTSLAALITPEPKSPCRPHLWRYQEIRAAMMEAGALITAREAERRVLVLENPGLRGQSKITTSLYAGVQMVLPGETAPAHRHSQSALRFVLEGSGAHTSVDGERTMMEVGDFVITPSGAWHDHGNQSRDPMLWLDGLDIPLIQFLDASFIEHHSEDVQKLTRKDGDSQARYGANMLPVDAIAGRLTSPIFNYPYARSRDALEKMRRANEWDSCHGLKMRYTNPETGGHAMPTIGAFLQLLPKGFKTSPYRATDASVFTAVEGHGRSRIGETLVEWGPKDIFVVPSWQKVEHEADEDAVLFSFSDRPVQEKLGIWRQNRGNVQNVFEGS
ncbi:MAG: gentisate 1,2-dioxygenase [Hyphomicrobiales bacterium]|nr:gentisate 1,2-dioxygenase [Hyphomicrobiales bacterium]MDE2114998.1 gentisate 1,2-dioxygenase [Hyphomicrobiales bacterium]